MSPRGLTTGSSKKYS
ncbi:MAG TPA: palindromic element RPE4 domain-containing protein [Rickettsia endosymbiont of Pyrocoelia pectoralis]|nr:palindromic element RPE4 domain-containing protein [Rickettsia endosymbiont of Pyrocoelia pectoralis]